MKIEQQIIHAQDNLIWLLSRKRYSIETYNKVCKLIDTLKAQLKEQDEKTCGYCHKFVQPIYDSELKVEICPACHSYWNKQSKSHQP